MSNTLVLRACDATGYKNAAAAPGPAAIVSVDHRRVSLVDVHAPRTIFGGLMKIMSSSLLSLVGGVL